jgi:archaeal flagellar protein FlaI
MSLFSSGDEKKVSETKIWEPEVVREGEDRILRFDLQLYPILPSLEKDPVTMARTISALRSQKDATKIVYFQKRDYEYGFDQTRMLVEIAQIVDHISRHKEKLVLFGQGVEPQFKSWYFEKNKILNTLVFFDLLRDPIGSFVRLKRVIREENVFRDGIAKKDPLYTHQDQYITILNWIKEMLAKTSMIKAVLSELEGFKIGSREIYDSLLSASIKPDFMYTRLAARFPEEGELLSTYSLGETEVNIFRLPDSSQYLYHILPPEFRLNEEEYDLLDAARAIMTSHEPTKQDFIDPRLMREVNDSIARELLINLAKELNILLSDRKLESLVKILLRYTIGFGLIEVLMEDDKIQDVSVNSPLGRIPLFIVHSEFQDCKTNIIPTRTEAESWATKLRLISGRPLDESNPILDTELDLPGARTRVSAVSPPMSHAGLAFSFRRHSNRPWTLPKLVAKKSLNALGAGLLSFLIDGKRSMLIAGTRSSGKTSFLSACLIDILRRYRIITIEDTLEIPVYDMRNLGYNIESLKVESALAMNKGGVSATDGIRSTLRLGDSALIVGEVRSKEAIALYEAMRVGASANVVAGTIHADSPYGVFDRVVNDIGVPRTSFKATDIIVIAAPIVSAGGLSSKKRIISITEVRKHWEEDPLKENAYVDLMVYNPHTDQLEPTSDLINGDSEILKSIASIRPQFAGNWDAIWEDILLRAKIKETLVKYGTKPEHGADHESNHYPFLEADFIVKSNDMYHNLIDIVAQELGSANSKRVYEEWERWFKKQLKIKTLKV